MNQSQPSAPPDDEITVGLPKTNLEFYTEQPQQRANETYNESPRIGWSEDAERNSPQSKSLTSASLIFASGGISLASSIGFGPYFIQYGTKHIQFCWFIAVIIGACISTVLVDKIPKRIFYLVSSVLVIINGVLYIALTQNRTAVISARYCDGIAFGLTLIPAIVAGSEQSVRRFRGRVLSVEQMNLAVGVMFGIYFREKINGVLAVTYGLLALLSAFLFTTESPVFHLSKDNEIEAVDVLRKLQKPHTVINESYSLLHECKALLEEDLTRGRSLNVSNSWIPMIKMILFRCFVSMSFSFPLNMALHFSMTSYTYIYVVMRLIGVVFGMYFMDTVGRRKPSALLLLVSGGILFAAGIQGVTGKIIVLMIIYQILSGAVAPTSTCYLGEAFSVSVKPYFILAAVISENILQILVCCFVSIDSISLFYCILGGLQVFYAFVFFFTMPETKQTTLREALRLFKTILVNSKP